MPQEPLNNPNTVEVPAWPDTDLKKLADEIHLKIMKQRQSVLMGFIAEHGCKPSEIMQCLAPGVGEQGPSWFLRKMTPEEIAFRDKVQKQAQPPGTCPTCGNEMFHY